jgi:hypothetical protein
VSAAKESGEECRKEVASRQRFHSAESVLPTGVVECSAEGDAGSECQGNRNKDLGSETRTVKAITIGTRRIPE